MRIYFTLLAVYMAGSWYAQAQVRLAGNVHTAQNQPLDGAHIYIDNLHALSLPDGSYSLRNIPAGSHHVVISYIGFKGLDTLLPLYQNQVFDAVLQPESTQLKEIVVSGIAQVHKPLVSQAMAVINGKELMAVRGGSLGEALQDIPGVTTFSSGPSIFKPVIHGLHSNRILIFNNGVRQEGQQWGSEHAPEIDPFIASRLSVIKGAASIRYGADAIGGVILVEPAGMPETPGISGEVNTVYATNNRMGVLSGIMQGAFDKSLKGLSWRVQGTVRRAGNSETPHYYLDNTGFMESDYSLATGYARNRFKVNLYYSSFSTKLGIFSGTHAETVADLQAIISRPRPLTPSYFTYTIGRPYQQVGHSLFKADAHYDLSGKSLVDIVYGRQRNIRSEYDYLPLSGRETPELYLSLITNTVDIIYKYNELGSFSINAGVNGMTQGNVRKYEMLIPNFRNYSGGIFYINQWKATEKLTLEAGLRYDYRWLKAYTLNENTAQVVTPVFKNSNITGTIGSQYYISKNLSWVANAGTAWRPPSLNELMSKGVHQSAVAYEIGNPGLTTERAVNLSTSFKYQAEKATAEIGLYDNYINGYIFLKPSLELMHTVRGSYPVYNYTQVNAVFRGIDLSATVKIAAPLKAGAKATFLYAWNKSINSYLQQVPPQQLQVWAGYSFKDYRLLKNPLLSISTLYTARQNRVPKDSDYLSPPADYTLVNLTASFEILAGKQLLNINIVGNNLLNKAYRNYMDRFRYFGDEPGRNISCKVNIPF